MSVKDRDPITGHKTTGHEWDGITELNTSVPRAVWIFAIVTHVWAVVMWFLYPTWPLVTTYTKGLLGSNDHARVERQVVAANLARADWSAQIEALEVDEILADPLLAGPALASGHQLFGDNCAACHGYDANGGPGYPSLIDDAWLWGGDADTVMETIRVGINNDHDESRYAEMSAFGRDGMLSRDEIRIVADYVLSLSGTRVPADRLAAGEEIFMDNCASCHGEDARGDHDLGAPDLTDDFWIYGGTKQALFETIYGGRQGWMPAWEHRLSPVEIKMLTAYVLNLGGHAEGEVR